MDNTLKVGAKHLASMMLPAFCPRCFWYRLHCGDAPFSIFPSIFSDIDLFTKKLVHANIDKYGHPPKWLGPLSEAEGYKNVGFLKWHDEENDVLLKGGPDAVFHGEKGLFVGDAIWRWPRSLAATVQTSVAGLRLSACGEWIRKAEAGSANLL
jgi:hypothetical protein